MSSKGLRKFQSSDRVAGPAPGASSSYDRNSESSEEIAMSNKGEDGPDFLQDSADIIYPKQLTVANLRDNLAA